MIGQFATSKAGHDKGQIYVITAAEGEFVYLCDGRLKPVEKPKKKRIKHIQIINATVPEVLRDRLINKETVSNEEIKYAIKIYRKDN